MSNFRRRLSKRAAIALLAILAFQATFAASDEPVTLVTPTGTIHGSLRRPDGVDRSPVVLLIAGSGPDDRDGNVVGTKVRPGTLELMATALADAGFASVRYDKRGVAASRQALVSESDARIETYADDAAGWVDQLASDARFTGVAIVGHSEGSLLGMMAARKTGSPLRAFVSVAGPARAAASILRAQMLGKVPPELVQRNEAILSSLEHGQRVDDVPAPLAAFYRPSVQPYLISYFRYVPADLIASLRIPCLIVQGDADIQVAVSEGEALHVAQPKAELLVVPGMTHVLKLARPGAGGPLSTFFDPTLPLAPAFTRGLVDFLSRNMTSVAQASRPTSPSTPSTP